MIDRLIDDLNSEYTAEGADHEDCLRNHHGGADRSTRASIPAASPAVTTEMASILQPVALKGERRHVLTTF